MKQRSQAKNCFCGVNERKVLEQVGEFGERISASVFRGDIISKSQEFPTVDVANYRHNLAVQVKMCNGHHAARPTPKQVESFYSEVYESPFLFTRGLYCLLFYRGVKGGKEHGKSKIWSKKYSKEYRQQVIVKELQYMYLIDVRLIMHLMVHHSSKVIRKGAIVSSEGKKHRKTAVYLKRSFLASFRESVPEYLKILDEAFGENRWRIYEDSVRLRFRFSNRIMLRPLPVYYIGSKKHFKVVRKLLHSRHASIS